ncbi:type II toxin-antitoxin system RelE family toxin [Moorena producens]|uniref:type II toxin-antitoxin system RelE family toxin n=1 Tax=Moorena producens TaxID=1155739 RepID=UPI001E3F48FB|nr:hypothetical protein [Moorena producens]
MIDYIILKQAERYLMRMQTDDKIRIINALDTLISNPSTLDIKSLKGRPEFRLRVGKSIGGHCPCNCSAFNNDLHQQCPPYDSPYSLFPIPDKNHEPYC